jgi:hypothetical protein
MAFHTRDYDVFILKGTAGHPQPWTWESWQPWAAALAPFSASPRGQPGVRCTVWCDRDRKHVPFGTLGWDDKSHQRWTFGSPVTREASDQWKFIHTEAWAPRWTVCEREHLAPDFFFSLRNPAMGSEYGKPPYPFVVCALAAAGDERRDALAQALHPLAKALPAALFATKRRPWGIASGGGFTHSIQDMNEAVLSGAVNPHSIDADRLPETWTVIDVA